MNDAKRTLFSHRMNKLLNTLDGATTIEKIEMWMKVVEQFNTFFEQHFSEEDLISTEEGSMIIDEDDEMLWIKTPSKRCAAGSFIMKYLKSDALLYFVGGKEKIPKNLSENGVEQK